MQVVVKGGIAQVSIAGGMLVPPVWNLDDAPSGGSERAGGSPVLVESDLERCFEDLQLGYLTAVFSVPGVLQYKQMLTVSALSTVVNKLDDPIVTSATTGMILCEVTTPAMIPIVFTSDPLPFYQVTFTIAFAGQTTVNTQ